MEGAYLFLLIIILSGYLFTKNIGINILQCVIVCALFGGSQDPLDFYNYEDIYNTVKQGYDVSYEIGYVWLNDICGKLGCSYIEFRYIAGILFCSAISNFLPGIFVCLQQQSRSSPLQIKNILLAVNISERFYPSMPCIIVSFLHL